MMMSSLDRVIAKRVIFIEQTYTRYFGWVAFFLPLVIHPFGASFSHFCVFYMHGTRALPSRVYWWLLSLKLKFAESRLAVRVLAARFLLHSFALMLARSIRSLSQRVCTLFDLLYNHFFLDGGGDAFCVKCGRFVLSSRYVGMEAAKKKKKAKRG